MDDNVTELKTWEIAKMICDLWLDSYSDNGAIYRRSKQACEVVRKSVSEEEWERAILLASRMMGQS
jgi:hypothetical protein